MGHLRILGHAELTTAGMNEIGETTSGPFKIVEVECAWGVGILDSHDRLQWVMKGNYTILDLKSISIPEEKESGQIGHVHDVWMEGRLDHLLLTLSNSERTRLAEKLNCLDE